MMKRTACVPVLLLFLAGLSCGQSKSDFDAASAYGFVKKQVEFPELRPTHPAPTGSSRP
jgi:hypothetical protein